MHERVQATSRSPLVDLSEHVDRHPQLLQDPTYSIPHVSSDTAGVAVAPAWQVVVAPSMPTPTLLPSCELLLGCTWPPYCRLESGLQAVLQHCHTKGLAELPWPST